MTEDPGAAAVTALGTLSPSPSPDFEERRRQSFWERMDAIEAECRRGHTALRGNVIELQAQTAALAQALKTLSETVTALAGAPVEMQRVRFTPQALSVIFGTTATVASLVIGATVMVRSGIQDLNTRMVADVEVRRLSTQRADERYVEITKALERQEQQRREDKAAAAQLLRKYDDDTLLRDLKLGVRK